MQINQESHIDLSGHQSVASLIASSCEKYGEKPAFSCLGKTLSFQEVAEKSSQFARYLQHCTDLEVGDRIAIQLPNLLQFPVVAYGAMQAGLVLVNTNPLYTPREMKHQFTDAGVKAIVILADLLPQLTSIIEDTEINTVIATNAIDFVSSEGHFQSSAVADGQLVHQALNDVLALGARQAPVSPVNVRLNDTAVLQYTGGTTGLSKGAVLNHKNLLSNAEQSYQRFKHACVEGEDTYISPLPLYHIYAFLVNLILAASKGAHNVLIPNPRDLDAFVSAIEPHKFTVFTGINTLFVGLCHHPDFKTLDFSSLNLTMSGGSALTQNAAQLWKQVTGCNISEGYGLSETSPVLCFNEPGNERLGTIGYALVGTDIQIWDDNNQEVERGEEGELVAKGPQVMSGYWQNENATKESIINGYFKTGDVAIHCDDGRFKIVDRKKDMIIVSGFNVYPNEIEDVLSQHQQIIEAAVVGEVDDHSGEKVCAYVVLAEGKTLTSEAIVEFCKEQLTGYKVPKKIVFLDELPKSTVGKVLRRELRAN